jgi:hypothetical protein
MPAFDDEGYPADPYAEVLPGLAQASSWLTPLELLDNHGFDASVDVGGWDRSAVMAGRAYTFLLLDDVPWIEDPDAIHELGRAVADMVTAGQRVVVNCAAGLNRSGLIVGRALIHLGHSPRNAIRLIRAARGEHALFNRAFEEFLLLDCSPASETLPPASHHLIR